MAIEAPKAYFIVFGLVQCTNTDPGFEIETFHLSNYFFSLILELLFVIIIFLLGLFLKFVFITPIGK